MAILVPYDGSKPAQQALEYAVEHHPDEEIVLFGVAEAAGGYTGATLSLAREAMKELREETRGDLSGALEELQTNADVDVTIETAVGKPAREIVAYAEEADIEEIVIGNHGRGGVSRVLLGSVAETVVRRSPVPVTVVR